MKARKGSRNRGKNIPCRLLLRIPHDAVRVGTRRAAVSVLVVLVEGIGAPEDAVAVRAGVALVALVELVLVALPVKLALEGDVAEGAPVSALGFGAPSVAALDGRRRRRGQRWRSNLLAPAREPSLRRYRAHRGRRGHDAGSPGGLGGACRRDGEPHVEVGVVAQLPLNSLLSLLLRSLLREARVHACRRVSYRHVNHPVPIPLGRNPQPRVALPSLYPSNSARKSASRDRPQSVRAWTWRRAAARLSGCGSRKGSMVTERERTDERDRARARTSGESGPDAQLSSAQHLNVLWLLLLVVRR